MAYGVLLASVSDDQVTAYRERSRPLLAATLSIRCSHVLTSWVQPTRLRDLLRHAIDGGQNLRSDLWHPLRVPAWHSSVAVAEIEPQLRQVWSDLLAEHGPSNPTDWYVIQISKVLQVFGHALASHDGIVSFLEPPTDHERAEKVVIPVVDPLQASSLT